MSDMGKFKNFAITLSLRLSFSLLIKILKVTWQDQSAFVLSGDHLERIFDIDLATWALLQLNSILRLLQDLPAMDFDNKSVACTFVIKV